jgi:16S rRNA (guanine527-N7)-methyltransferase
VFAARSAAAESYAALLSGVGVEHGLIGPRELDRLWSRHLLPGAVPATLIPRGSRVCDVGSGAGLPGLPIALARPDCAVTLVDPMERRCRFLARAVGDADLADQVTVRRARAEDLAGESPEFDVVIARALARLPMLLELLLPLCRAGGQVLAIKGSGVPAEIEEAADLLGGPRVASWDLVELTVPGMPGVADGVRLVRVIPAASVLPAGPRSHRQTPTTGRGRGREMGRR